MSGVRRSWPKALAIALVPLVVMGALFAVTLRHRTSDAENAAADLDGLFSLSAVATMEGALHEEGTMAIAYTIGFIEPAEFSELVAATDDARTALREEITYYAADDPLGSALRAIDESLDALTIHREAIENGELDGPVVAPYRASIELTAAAIAPIRDRLVVPGMDPIALLAIDEARRASSDAVMAATAAALGQGEASAVADALERLDAAETAFGDAAASIQTVGLEDALGTATAQAARSGVVAVAAGESFDLLAWADVAADWPVAYADTEVSAVETGLTVLETRATDAETEAKTYAIVAGVAALSAVALTLALARRPRGEGRTEAGTSKLPPTGVNAPA